MRKSVSISSAIIPIRLRENLNMDDLIPSQWIKSHPEAVVLDRKLTFVRVLTGFLYHYMYNCFGSNLSNQESNP